MLAPGDEDTPGLPRLRGAAGKAVPIPYNGSVARLQFGLVSAARVRRWLRDGAFDVVHVHEPAPPSLSLLACMIHDGPLVATFHAATTRSRFLSMFDTVLQPFLEKLTGRIAVSPAARKVIVEHLGGDAVVIPNGVAVAHFAGAEPLRRLPARRAARSASSAATTSPARAWTSWSARSSCWSRDRPGLRLLVAGRGDAEEFLAELPAARAPTASSCSARSSEADKARLLRSVDVYCAPNTGRRASASSCSRRWRPGTPIVASDLEAFRRVLDGGTAGALFRDRRRRRRWPRARRRARRPGPARASWSAAGAAAVAPVRLVGGRRRRSCGSTSSRSPATACRPEPAASATRAARLEFGRRAPVGWLVARRPRWRSC